MCSAASLRKQGSAVRDQIKFWRARGVAFTRRDSLPRFIGADENRPAEQASGPLQLMNPRRVRKMSARIRLIAATAVSIAILGGAVVWFHYQDQAEAKRAAALTGPQDEMVVAETGSAVDPAGPGASADSLPVLTEDDATIVATTPPAAEENAVPAVSELTLDDGAPVDQTPAQPAPEDQQD